MERTLFQEEHSLLRSTFCEYIKKSILPDYPKWEKEGQVPREMWLDAGNQDIRKGREIQDRHQPLRAGDEPTTCVMIRIFTNRFLNRLHGCLQF